MIVPGNRQVHHSWRASMIDTDHAGINLISYNELYLLDRLERALSFPFMIMSTVLLFLVGR
jgi:hypothetical protein